MGISLPVSFLLLVTDNNYTVEKSVLTLTPLLGDQQAFEYSVAGLSPGRTYLVSVAGISSAGSGPAASVVIMTKEEGEDKRMNRPQTGY